MIDTITLVLENPSLLSISQISSKLQNAYESISKENEVFKINGYLENLRISLSHKGLLITGSLSKFFLGSNIYELKPYEIEEAIDLISERLALDISQAFVYRLDIAKNYEMKLPVECYLPLLESTRYMERFEKVQNIYFQNKKRSLVFYNKVKELKAKKEFIPENLKFSNLLRYELRFTKKVGEQLNNGSKLRAYQLYDPVFHESLVERYKSEFQKVKFSTISMLSDKVNTPKKAIDFLAVKRVESMSQKEYEQYRKELKAKNSFKHPADYSRFHSMMNHRRTKYQVDAKNDLIEELTQKILHF